MTLHSPRVRPSQRRLLSSPSLSSLALLVASCLLTPSLSFAQSSSGNTEVSRPQLTQAPELLEFVEAEYPEEEKAEGKAATVVLQIAISAEGLVEEAVVLESAGPAFDAAAVEAVKQFRFRPAEIDHRPAPVKLTYRYQFVQQIEEVVATTGDFRGVVVNRKTGEPLAGVQVSIEGQGQQTTDETGAFSFEDVEPGVFQVTLSREDLTPLQTQETIEAGHAIEARYTIEIPEEKDEDEEKDDFELVVQAPRLVKQVVSTEVSSEEARLVPGTQGDVLKVVENLPGVARASAGSGEVVVWGAAPQDTRTYVGAVRIPMLYHFGGLRSVIHNDRVQSVELIPGGYGAAFGRGLGGLVLVRERAPAQDRLRGSVQADLLDASAALTAPLSDRLSFAVSGRRSHIKDLSGLLSDQSFQQFFTLPQYYDGQARLRYEIAPGEHIEFGGLLSGDSQTRTQPSSDPSRRVSETRSLYFQRVDVAYKKQLQDGSEVELSPWYGHDSSQRTGNFGGVPTSLEVESHLAGFRGEWRGRLEKSLTAQAGLDVEVVVSESRRSGSITAPPREGDPYLFGRPPADQINTDRWGTVLASAAPYAELDWTPFGESFHITPGIRFEPYFLSVEKRRPTNPNLPDEGAYRQDISVQPRLALRYTPTERLTLKGAVGIYRQPPLPEDLSATFGNPGLGIATGQHFLGGASYRFFEQLTVEATLFHTRSEDLAARNPALSPRIGEALIQEGEGRSVGAQFLVRKDKGDTPFFGWIAYTVMKSERKDGSGQNWRLFDYDQTHVLTALASYDLGAGFEVGIRGRVASGYPRTPVTGAFYDARKNGYEPILGAYNSTRIPLFWQIDARATKRFSINETELEIYLDVQNVLNRENPEEIAYSPTFTDQRYILGLPLLPVLGARWSF